MLALHEGSVVAMAAGHALGTGAPALALLHSTPGFGNAVAALATARLNRAPLVIVVGQQDRRHLALDPFLAGKLDGLAGAYPVHSEQPARAQDVPGAIVRAYHEAATARGPAVVDRADGRLVRARPGAARDHRPAAAAPLPGRRPRAPSTRSPACWTPPSVPRSSPAPAPTGPRWSRSPSASAARSTTSRSAAQAGFPQDHPQFAGHLPARRARLREMLSRTTPS